jgi:hypothetical protein
MDFLKEMYIRVPKFGKQYKYFLGGEIIRYAINVVRFVIRDNNTKTKEARRKELELLSDTVNMLLVNVRIANELKQLGNARQYLYVMEKAVVISRQAEGWKQSI